MTTKCYSSYGCLKRLKLRFLVDVIGDYGEIYVGKYSCLLVKSIAHIPKGILYKIRKKCFSF